MKRTPLAALALLATLSAAPQETAPAPDDAEARLASLDWLTGRWRGTFDGMPFESTYTSAEGGIILSVSKQYRPDGRVGLYEFEVFGVRDGEVFLRPHPYGKAADAFLLTECDPAARRAVFEDPTNDFPSRITYWRAADDRLVIDLHGEQQGRPAQATADLRRAE